jgi:hypothetical protein
MKSVVIWIVIVCNFMGGYRRFGQTCIYFYGPKEARQKAKWLSLPPASFGFLICILFDLEGGGRIFFRNFGIRP